MDFIGLQFFILAFLQSVDKSPFTAEFNMYLSATDTSQKN